MPSLKNLLQKINTHSKNLSKLSSNNIVKLVDKDIFKLSDSQIHDLIDIIEDREKFEGITKDVRKDLIERLNDIIEIKKVLGGIRGTNTLTPAEIRKKERTPLDIILYIMSYSVLVAVVINLKDLEIIV
jgi:hypothetical protein